MNNMTRITGKLEIVKRMKNSINGNPQFMLACDGYKFRTPANSMLAYSVSNYADKNVEVILGTHYGALTLHEIKEV